MRVVKAEMRAGLKSTLFEDRVWQASNLAMWAMSPPEARCFIVHITNYDYVPLEVAKITIETGDARERFDLTPPEGAALKVIGIGGEHKWAIDALPIFIDVAHAIYEDQLAQEKEIKEIKETEHDEAEAAPPRRFLSSFLIRLLSPARGFSLPA